MPCAPRHHCKTTTNLSKNCALAGAYEPLNQL
jgi:hypothetical protein